MNNISTDNDVFSSLGLVRQPAEKAHNELVLEDFLELMITELTHQDPFKPMENTELATQMSQFATVSGIGDLKNGFNSLSESLTSEKTLQAANLVGHQVLVPGGSGYLEAGGTTGGLVDLESSASDLVVRVTDSAGALVREIDLGTRPEGEVAFNWDGITDSGDFAPAGRYWFSAEAQLAGESIAPATLTKATVSSVNIGAAGQGITLNLEGLGPTSLADVAEIY